MISSPTCAGRQCSAIAVGLGVREQLAVQLVGREIAAFLASESCVAHADPDVGVDGVGLGGGLTAGRWSARLRRRRWRLTRRARPRRASARSPRAWRPRSVMPAIAPSTISDAVTLLPSPTYASLRPSSVPKRSLHRQQIGERLARVVILGQEVEDRDCSPARRASRPSRASRCGCRSRARSER